MRCQRCEFENMPGVQKCLRCSSVLGAGDEPIDVHPPRAVSWKKPFRSIGRKIRKVVPFASLPGDLLHGRVFPEWANKITRIGCFGAILSIIPGLAHIIQGRFKSIWWWVLGWFVILLTALFLFGSQVGMLVLGLAIGTHVWIAVHSAVLKEYDQLLHRLIAYFVILLFYYIGYQAAGPVIFYGIPGAYSVANSPDMKIQSGDYLLGSRGQTSHEDITRGSFVLTELASIQNYVNLFRVATPRGYVQVVGLPGEKVAVEEGKFVIDDEILDSERYPVPGWLKKKTFSKVLSKDEYFISALYSGAGYNEGQMFSVCLKSQTQIEAKAFARWMPLSRKGFIRESE